LAQRGVQGSLGDLTWPTAPGLFSSAAMAVPRTLPAAAVAKEAEKPKFNDTTCGHIVGLLLICYGLFNTFLFIKFTPVYAATQCGDQSATLQQFSVGKTIKVGLQIQVTCWNPNGYAVQILSASPGHVYIGEARNVSVGQLTLLEGSTLPEMGTGNIRVHMDAELSPATSAQLVPRFLTDSEIPMFLDLKFNVGVNVNFGLKTFGTTAPFEKRCGMNMAGVLVQTNTRLGPMICRDSYEELLGQLPQVGEAHVGSMSFSGAQMDPDRIAMGEMAKNVSIITVGGLAYAIGIAITYHWFMVVCIRVPSQAGGGQHAAYTNIGPRGWPWQSRSFLLQTSAADMEQGSPKGNCAAVGTLLNFVSCGALSKRPPKVVASPTMPMRYPHA